MELSEIAGRFLVDNDVGKEKLAVLIEKLLPYCRVQRDGVVDITAAGLSAPQAVRLVMAARLAASKLEGSEVAGEVGVEEIAEFAGIAKNQARARLKDAVDSKFAERTSRGSYRARAQRLDTFLEELTTSCNRGKP